jgi:hypothetical protein
MKPQETLHRHLTNRDALLAAIAGEVFGPGSALGCGETLLAEPKAFDLTKPVEFEKWEDYSKVRPVVDGTGEEILRDERPSSRFGMGILFPELDDAAREKVEEQLASEEVVGTDDVSEAAPDDEEMETRMRFDKEQEARQRKIEIKAERSSKSMDSGPIGEEESDSSSETSDLRLANLRRQRSLGISFVVDAESPGDLEIRVTGGRYKRFKDVRIKERKSDREITWWARRAVDIIVPIRFKDILENDGLPVIEKLQIPTEPGIPDLKLQLEIRVRGRERIPGDDHPVSARLLTVTLVNRGKCTKGDAVDEHCLFQARFSAKATACGSSILPYPRHRVVNQGQEQQSLDLLYRHEQTFATGHGCAGAWQADEAAYCANSVSAEVLPYHESPAITPNLEFVDSKSGEKKELTIPLSLLGDDARVKAAQGQLDLMVDLYEDWINQRRKDLPQLESTYKAAAQRHVEACDDALKRMRKGIQLLAADPNSKVSVAFRLTNQAMLIQALASGAETRVQSHDENAQRVSFLPEYHEPDLSSDKAVMRAWRPFQIAFLLMNLPALADPTDPGREIVDLIWFPTGGGKTEAYLGCAAFSILMRRIRDPRDIGTHVLMRYTLRLLTAQQFQRASSLICALEHLRSGRENLLGKDSFTIGIWVGGDTTPNSRASAVRALSSTKRNGEEDYKMVLLKCPWCGAEMGPKRKPGQQRRYEVHGVRQVGQDVRLHCPDQKCSFSSGLPVKVIDDDLYEEPPTYVIATVDKFASLAWRAECRSLFGIGDDGQRVASPPGLIIQDELHLITGPLGSMVGLYETLIDELATDHRGDGAPIKPKLIAATATTRASDRQIRDLYARNHTCIFPAPGLDAADSFFAKYERDEHGVRKPGRRYVGFLPLNYSSALTASVRIYAAAMSAAYGFATEDERDPWWTLLVFYNSLRELGANLTLFGADIPERMKDIQRRWFPGFHMRFVNQVLELTGRLANSEVPRALEALGRTYKEKPSKGRWPVDACLASNIIEVGVDVDRLGLMAVAGQPKTTAQYIQATGRVGRRLPGLILVNYGATKARDRSHYEHFQSYHSRLYAQVEPASVTPFTIPVLERALHAVIVAHARQTLPVSLVGRSSSPSPFAGTSLEQAAEVGLKLLERRIGVLANGDNEAEARMLVDLNECHSRRIGEWKRFQPVKWLEYFPKKNSGDQPLLRPYGSPCPPTWEGLTWETPNSLRGVDAECKPSIPHYLVADED